MPLIAKPFQSHYYQVIVVYMFIINHASGLIVFRLVLLFQLMAHHWSSLHGRVSQNSGQSHLQHGIFSESMHSGS